MNGAESLYNSSSAQNLMVGAGNHLRICDYGLAGYCHKQADDPWVPGVEHKDRRGPTLICATFMGGTATYMSEQLVELKRVAIDTAKGGRAE